MPKIGFSKESLEGAKPVPEGLYDLRLEGFEPEFSKDRASVNLNPVLKVVNHASLNGNRVYGNLNSKAGWIIEAMCHAMQQKLVQNTSGGFDIPGEFVGPDDNPEAWVYQGPLTGSVGKAFVKTKTWNGRDSSNVDQWMCAVPGCVTKHPSGLAK